jgi:thiosulfate dehydrogenase [quinone] large subunit
VSVVDSWKRQKPSSRLLRGFLGVTFLYAGVQKLSDPNFFKRGGTTYIGSQIQAFAHGSPIAPLLRFVGHFPILTGLVVALGEIAIGVAVLLGFGALVASVAGCLVSLILWLSATWHVHPFFLGSDSIYCVAWAAYGLRLFENRQVRKAVVEKRGRRAAQEMDRRSFLRGGVVAAATLGVGLFARVLSRFAPADASSASGLAAATSRTASHVSSGAAASPAASPAAPSPTAVQGQVISSLNKLRVGQPVAFVTGNGTPGALFRLSKDKVVAYSRICTHAGCTVGYDPSAKVLYCPCHGAEFDPVHGARVLAGPAPVPLPKIKVAIDPKTQNVVLPS